MFGCECRISFKGHESPLGGLKLRQTRIISYQTLEARIEYLENLVSEMHQYLDATRTAIDELKEFLEEEIE